MIIMFQFSQTKSDCRIKIFQNEHHKLKCTKRSRSHLVSLTLIFVFLSLITVLALFDATIYQKSLLQSYLELASIHTSFGRPILLLQLVMALVVSLFMDIKKFRSVNRNESKS